MLSSIGTTSNASTPASMCPPDADASVVSTPNWSELVARIQTGDPESMQQLYTIFSRGLKYLLCRKLGPQDLEDKVHDVFLIVVKAIQDGSLREPERLMGFVRAIAQRTVARSIDANMQGRRRECELLAIEPCDSNEQTPEQLTLIRERAAIAKAALEQLNSRDRELLKRFYLLEQTQQQICAEMQLTETQFRLLKSRAKARFGEIGKKHTNPILVRRPSRSVACQPALLCY